MCPPALCASRTFEMQIINYNDKLTLTIAQPAPFICAPTLRYLLLAHMHAYATLCHVLLAHFNANYKGKPAPSTSTFCAPTHPKMCQQHISRSMCYYTSTFKMCYKHIQNVPVARNVPKMSSTPVESCLPSPQLYRHSQKHRKWINHTVGHYTTGVSTCPALRRARHFPSTSYFLCLVCTQCPHIFATQKQY